MVVSKTVRSVESRGQRNSDKSFNTA
jgi:hypothetical protein